LVEFILRHKTETDQKQVGQLRLCPACKIYEKPNKSQQNLMKIIGAGMAGLIAGHMLRRHSPEIHEAASSLPNNHSALLRFRSDAVAKAT
jgi:hypothetical protein